MMASRRSATTVRVVLVAVLAIVAGAVGYGVTATARPLPRPASVTSRPARPVPHALAAAAATPVAQPAGVATSDLGAPSASALAARLRGVLGASGLGAGVHARVVDVPTGAVLLDRSGAVGGAPASTAKLLVAAAVLAVRAPTDRITTTVRRGPGGSVVLVGGGDPTLTGASPGHAGAYPDAARLSDLAASVRRAGLRPTRVLVDDTAFGGPTISPAWAPDDVPSDYASAITAVIADGGRPSPSATVRTATPDLAAGHELAALLGRPSLPVMRTSAAVGAVLGTVRSATMSQLIEQMLLESDNVIAECLARQVAITEREPVTFTGSAAAIRSVLGARGVTVGARMDDGSGLAAADRLSPAALTGVLRLAVRTPRLRLLLDLLPVAGWSGTLATRDTFDADRAAAGVLRAKTGTLTGVSALAGVVHDRSGRLLAFAVLADHAPSTPAAEAALDAVGARLAGCGC